MDTEPQANIAVLIDADNTTPKRVKDLLDEVAKHGRATIRRAYGDWTTNQLAGWKAELNAHAIAPVQQFAYTHGKNATDSALIIEAMDLLYTGDVDSFALVSSDSDFTRLASRLRESGRTVYGFGERKTPKPFQVACDRFLFLDLLGDDSTVQSGRAGEGAAPAPATGAEPAEPDLPGLERLLSRAVLATSNDENWAGLAAVGQYLNTAEATFDSRNYGFPKLSDLVKAQTYLDVEGSAHGLRVRLRSRRPPKKAAATKATAAKKPAAAR